VLQADTENADAHNNLVRMLQLQGKMDEAINHYHQTLKINPNHSGASEAIGSLSEKIK